MKKVSVFLLAALFLCFAVVLPGCTNTDNSSPSGQEKPTTEKTFEGITFPSQTFSYDGEPKSIYAENVPNGANTVYTGNGQTEPGIYTVTVTITKDGYKPLTLQATLTVAETLEWLKDMESETILSFAENINSGSGLTGEYTLVILDKAETLQNLTNYTFSDNYDENKVVRGLFVRFDAALETDPDTILFTAYYMFAIEFDSDMQAVEVSTDFDQWAIRPCESNPKILYQFA